MYSRILVPLDGSKLSESALSTLKQFAREATRVTLLRALSAQPPVMMSSTASVPDMTTIRETERKHIVDYLHKHQEALRQEGLEVTTGVSDQPPAEAILDYAEEEGVDLIIMSSTVAPALGAGFTGAWPRECCGTVTARYC